MPHSQLAPRGSTWSWARVFLGSWLVALGILSVGGCVKTQAKTAPDGPPLEMPAPPPRVIAPAEEPAAAPPAEPTEPTPAPANTIRRPARRPATSIEPTQKPPETSTPEPLPQPSQPEAAPPASTAPTLPLRAPGSAEKPIRDRLAEAQRDLGRVDYAKLSQDGRVQYEQSKRFVQQAEQALKEQNFVFAQTLADKAATIAAELLGR